MQEVVDLKAKVQQATSENMGLMDNWKSKLDSLSSYHQKSLEDLKATLNSGPGAQQKEIGELKAVMQGIKMEHQLELGNLQAKHNIETAMHVKEKEGLWQKLQETQNELARLQQQRWAQLECRLASTGWSCRRPWTSATMPSSDTCSVDGKLRLGVLPLDDDGSRLRTNLCLQNKLTKRDKEVTALMSQTKMLRARVSALVSKCKSGEKKVDTL
ncbi:Cap-Gly Domain-Containing Linker Protein 2 [Manis pentadactyla]|nr:Cap-Gly Domain-Containing Linker Protein 2 [Manis pentadactyla]